MSDRQAWFARWLGGPAIAAPLPGWLDTLLSVAAVVVTLGAVFGGFALARAAFPSFGW
jgi:hypothetical protein